MSGSSADRRTILGAGALVVGVGTVATAAQAQGSAGGAWTPAAEDQDAWLDKPGTRHRMVFDTTSADAAGEGIHFANNFYVANESGYGLKADALGVVVILRAMATAFGYNDSIWAKYGKAFAKSMELKDEAASAAKTRNPLLASDSAGAVTLASLHAKGARYAVCGMATHGIAGMLAKDAGKTREDVEADIKANLIPGAVIVPAGIVAVNRAQEHGYAFAYVG